MVYPVLTNDAIMTTETTPMKDLGTCCGLRIEMTKERILGIAREYMGSPLHDGYNSSRALKCYILFYSTNFIKFRVSHAKTAELRSLTACNNLNCAVFTFYF